MRRTSGLSACRPLIVLVLVALLGVASAQVPPSSLELSRPVRSFEFLPVVGTRAGLFGNETGNLEAWVYPLKILRNFHLNVLTEGRTLPAETLARTVTVRPESIRSLAARHCLCQSRNPAR